MKKMRAAVIFLGALVARFEPTADMADVEQAVKALL